MTRSESGDDRYISGFSQYIVLTRRRKQGDGAVTCHKYYHTIYIVFVTHHYPTGTVVRVDDQMNVCGHDLLAQCNCISIRMGMRVKDPDVDALNTDFLIPAF